MGDGSRSHRAFAIRHPLDEPRIEDVTAMTLNPATEQFEAQRPHLRAVAYRMLGSLSEADDAVQEAWLRLNRSDTTAVDNLAGWLTTVVARVCLDMLRSRRAKREDFIGSRLPDPVVADRADDPEQQALLADAVGLALLVVLDKLTPAERLAFVLHDMFGVPFEEIGPIVDRTPAAARQMASRARRRVRGAAPAPDSDLAAQRRVVDAFLAAARDGDFEGLVAVLHPDAVFRLDTAGVGRGARPPVVGAEAIAETVLETAPTFAHLGRPAIVNGAAGLRIVSGDRLLSIVGFTIHDGRIAAIDIVADPAKLPG
jgi:RNA polymerase sigma-70 factor (ECF subfamily)